MALHQALLSQVLPFIFHSSPLTYNFPKRPIWHWLRPVLFHNLMFTLRWLIQQCLSAQHMWLPVTPFVVDLRERHLEFWTPYSDGCTREHNSKVLTHNRWCALVPPKKALATRSPYSLPTHFPILPKDVIHSVARFRLRVHTLRFETATWNPSSSPSCDLCEADDDVQDEKHATFHCTHP